MKVLIAHRDLSVKQFLKEIALQVGDVIVVTATNHSQGLAISEPQEKGTYDIIITYVGEDVREAQEALKRFRDTLSEKTGLLVAISGDPNNRGAVGGMVDFFFFSGDIAYAPVAQAFFDLLGKMIARKKEEERMKQKK